MPKVCLVDEIARELNISRDSVAKYLAIDDFSPAAPWAATRSQGTVLDGFIDTIDQWLVDDAKQPRKQRHTAKRIFHRLRDELGDMRFLFACCTACATLQSRPP